MKVFTILTVFLIITISNCYKLGARDKYTFVVQAFPRCTWEDYDDDRIKQGLCEKVTMVLKFKDLENKERYTIKETKTCGNTFLFSSDKILLTDNDIDGSTVEFYYSKHSKFNKNITIFVKNCKEEYHPLDISYYCNLGEIGPR
uniref:NTR domain-containing protein n=1 Tax=Strongyloides papillosus TaxID=174720 RepID=A0A0N5BJW0_STREA